MDGKCSRCGFEDRFCEDKVHGRAPESCCTKLYEDALKQADSLYEGETLRFAAEAARQEADCYEPLPGGGFRPVNPRIKETMDFCRRMGYKRIGLAFCVGLMKEGRMLGKLLEDNGFEVVSASCKVGGVSKSRLGLSEEEQIEPGFEPMCNPIGQAMIMNEAKTDFNLALGLCVGHDSLFLKHCDALCTVIAAKDRVTGHNPLSTLYTSDSYYKYLKGKKE